MTYTSIFEKLLLVLNIISNSWVYIAFAVVSTLLVGLLVIKKISKKKCFLLVSLVTFLVLGYTICVYYEGVSRMMTSIIDNMFLNIYFPSAYAYLFILVLINVSAIGTLINPRTEKIYKTVNGVCLIITDFVLSLILEIIAKDNVDIFVKESMFTNANLITLLEVGVNIFITWVISLIAIYVINVITERIVIAKENRNLVKAPAVTINTEVAINEPELQEEYQTVVAKETTSLSPVEAFIPDESKEFIPNFTVTVSKTKEEVSNNFIPVVNNEVSDNSYIDNYNYDNNSFDLSSFIPKKQEVKPISILNKETDTTQIFDQILNNNLPYIKEESKIVSNIDETRNSYTLNDYRIFNKMLKDIKEHNQSNSITIDKNLEYRLITKYSSEAYDMFKTMLKIYSS